MTRKIIVLGGGAPVSPLHAGALLALDKLGIDFDALSCSGAGIAIGLLYASPHPKAFSSRRDALSRFTREMFVSDTLYSFMPVNFKVFLKPGPAAELYRQMIKPAYDAIENTFRMFGMRQSLDQELRDRMALMIAAASPSDLNPLSTGLCAHMPWIDQAVDFPQLSKSPQEVFINAYNLDKSRMEIFDGQEITADHFRASLSFPFLYAPYKLGDDYYIEGSAIETLCTGGIERYIERMKPTAADPLKVVVFDVLSSDKLIQRPRDLYKAWVQSIMVPLLRIAQFEIQLLEEKYRDDPAVEVLKIDFEVPEHVWSGVLDWSIENHDALFSIGYRAGRRFYERNRSSLEISEAFVPA